MTESRLAGLTQLRHVELLELAQSLTDSRNQARLRLARLSRDRLIDYVARHRELETILREELGRQSELMLRNAWGQVVRNDRGMLVTGGRCA